MVGHEGKTFPIFLNLHLGEALGIFHRSSLVILPKPDLPIFLMDDLHPGCPEFFIPGHPPPAQKGNGLQLSLSITLEGIYSRNRCCFQGGRDNSFVG